MKKCIKCERRFEDSVVKCPHCNNYLIGDYTSYGNYDTPCHRNSPLYEEEDSERPEPDVMRAETSAQRRRVEVIDDNDARDPEPNDSFAHDTSGTLSESLTRETDSNGSFAHDTSGTRSESFKRDAGGVTAATETHGANAKTTRSRQRRRHRRNNGLRVFTGVWQVFQIVLPILLIIGAVYFASLHWLEIRAFLVICGRGALIGAVAALLFSRHSMNAFSPRIMFTGALLGVVIACVIGYNAIDIDMDTLIEGGGTIFVMLLGMYFMTRSVFH